MDKELLFAPRADTSSGMPEDDVKVPGGSVRVRGLSRAEALTVRNLNDRIEVEQKILSWAMVDPGMTEAEVGRWQAASLAGEMEPVVDKVTELSGLAPSSAKEAVKGFEADPDTEFRALSSAETLDDGGAASGGNG